MGPPCPCLNPSLGGNEQRSTNDERQTTNDDDDKTFALRNIEVMNIFCSAICRVRNRIDRVRVRTEYSLVLVQLLLIPVLYSAQELTVRLACVTKDGITGLIRKHFGPFWAWFACTLHVTMCLQGQLSEFGSIAMLASQILTVPKWVLPVLPTAFRTYCPWPSKITKN